MAPRVRLGELLVEAQIITREQLEEVLALQKRDARRLGTLLIEAGVVTETQVTQVLSQQLSIPWVSLYHIDFSRQLLNLVPQELAEKYCLVPIFVRRVRGIGETLYVAMEDPTHEEAKEVISNHTKLPVRAMIAPPSDIKAAISVYYTAGADHASLADAQAAITRRDAALSPKEAVMPPAAPAGKVAAPKPRKPDTPPETGTAAKQDTPARLEAAAKSEPKTRLADAPPAPPLREPAARPQPDRAASPDPLAPTSSARPASVAPAGRERGAPPPKKGQGRRMLTLTLLDGTEIHLPSRSRAPEISDGTGAVSENLTTSDLIAALKALSHGADASEILGDQVRWEALFAALLSLLLKKHLISEREFVDEYKKI